MTLELREHPAPGSHVPHAADPVRDEAQAPARELGQHLVTADHRIAHEIGDATRVGADDALDAMRSGCLDDVDETGGVSARAQDDDRVAYPLDSPEYNIL
jgi:hypothetical protein